MKRVAVIGSGSWGTALAILLHQNGHQVTLWSFSKDEANQIMNERENKEFLPNVKIPGGIAVTTDCAQAVKEAAFVVWAVPSAYVRKTMMMFAPFFSETHIIISVSKGFDEEKKLRLSQVIQELAPKSSVAVLSGPSHAEEVSRGIPTACIASSGDMRVASAVQDLFMSDVFRVYTNSDMVGVELGGAVKNVMALAAGISDGLGFGDNTKAAIMTRGMAEMARLGVAMGADPMTFSGLSGIGDLIVTCTSMHSRNRRAGIMIGQGHSLAETLQQVHMVVEGANTVKVVCALAAQVHVEMPISTEVYRVLYEGKDLKQGVMDLLGRERTSENESNYVFNAKERL